MLKLNCCRSVLRGSETNKSEGFVDTLWHFNIASFRVIPQTSVRLDKPLNIFRVNENKINNSEVIEIYLIQIRKEKVIQGD